MVQPANKRLVTEATADTIAAAKINDTASATRGALNATYGHKAPDTAARPGNAAVFLGDSITLGSDDPTNGARGDAWPVYASLISGQRIHYVRNAGVQGNTAANMLARFDTDVTPYAPSVVFLNAGMNDAGTGVTLATYSANIKAIVDKIRAIKAVPVLANTTPSTATPTARRGNITLYNAWLSRYAEAEGIILLDFYRQMVDPATGALAAAYNNGDAIHPNPAGHKVLGQYAADHAAPLLPKWTPLLAGENADPNNLLAGGLFMVDTNADGIGDGWARYGGAVTGATPSITTDAAVVGKMQRITISATTASALYTQYKSATGVLSAGDKVAISGVMTSSGVSPQVQIQFYATGNLVRKPLVITKDVTRGAFYQEITAPAGVTGFEVFLQVAPGTGYVEFGQLGVYNLTTLGLATI